MPCHPVAVTPRRPVIWPMCSARLGCMQPTTQSTAARDAPVAVELHASPLVIAAAPGLHPHPLQPAHAFPPSAPALDLAQHATSPASPALTISNIPSAEHVLPCSPVSIEPLHGIPSTAQETAARTSSSTVGLKKAGNGQLQPRTPRTSQYIEAPHYTPPRVQRAHLEQQAARSPTQQSGAIELSPLQSPHTPTAQAARGVEPASPDLSDHALSAHHQFSSSASARRSYPASLTDFPMPRRSAADMPMPASETHTWLMQQRALQQAEEAARNAVARRGTWALGSSMQPRQAYASGSPLTPPTPPRQQMGHSQSISFKGGTSS